MSKSDLLLCVGVLALIALIIGLIYLLTPVDTELLLREAQTALADADFEKAESLALSVLSQDESSAAALMIAGKAASGRNEFSKALDYFERIPDDGSRTATRARYLSGDILLLKLNRLSESERLFRRAIEQDKDFVEAHDKLVHVLTVGARYREASDHVLELVRLGNLQRFCSKIGVFMLGGEADRPIDVEPSALKCHAADPEDPAPMIALAVAANHGGDYAEAERLLRKVTASHPEMMAGQVWLGRTLLNAREDSKFFAWNRALEDRADTHPDIWAVRGSMARLRRQPRVAVRCLFEAVCRDPNLERANFELAQVLRELGEKDRGAEFLQRADWLSKYRDTVGRVTKSPDIRYLKSASQLAESLGMNWEAEAWRLVARNPAVLNAAVELSLPRWVPEKSGESLQRSSAADNPALKVDLSHYPLPDWPQGTSDTLPVVRRAAAGPHASFEDRAAETGLVFQYNNSGDPENQILTMQETLGGGIGAFDFDGDGWPDIYLAQGGEWPIEEHRGQFVDRLFRNLGNGEFRDVTNLAGIVEDQFSHGVTVGDFNSDGFLDLLICNIGANRLFQNNGDGTFSDVSDTAAIGSNRWTPSALIADLNGDALPDIYAVNYVTAADVFTRVCKTADGILEPCPPNNFTPSQDQIFLNLGNGRFEEMTNSSGIGGAGGNGLGIVAMDVQGRGFLDIFIANDVTPNFFFVNKTKKGSTQLKFADEGLIYGLSLNTEGDREACMGVAVAINVDGTIDLFVGNFIDESNTLYRQIDAQTFVDVTREIGLDEPSRGITAFGTEFIDGDLDGDFDLIVTNGHISSTSGSQYQMAAQYFRNMGDGTYLQDASETLGPYFVDRFVGRGLALIDWNRDGASDVVITHLDAPVSLLTNTTQGRGHFVNVELRGVDSSRDAIGTTVVLEIGEKKLVRQLVGGDGYLVTNQKMLSFGLGPLTTASRMTIRWPSGLEQTFPDISADSHVLVVENCDRIFELSN